MHVDAIVHMTFVVVPKRKAQRMILWGAWLRGKRNMFKRSLLRMGRTVAIYVQSYESQWACNTEVNNEAEHVATALCMYVVVCMWVSVCVCAHVCEHDGTAYA